MLQGKTAVITGSGRGIGKSIALKLASHGANIVINDIPSSDYADETCEEVKKLGVECIVVKGDVRNTEDVQKLVSETMDKFGHIDIFVNNAGITRDGLIAMMKEENFDAVIGVNLKGTFNMIKHCMPYFIKQRSGKIVNVSSVSGIMGNAGQANYSASKAGVIGLTKSTAKELASRGVCCNAIAPGFIATDMTANLADNPLIAQIPMKRMGTAEEAANLIFFLSSPLSDYITGEVIKIDGGIAM